MNKSEKMLNLAIDKNRDTIALKESIIGVLSSTGDEWEILSIPVNMANYIHAEMNQEWLFGAVSFYLGDCDISVDEMRYIHEQSPFMWNITIRKCK